MKYIYLLLAFISNTVFGSDINRAIIAELDPIAPASSNYESQTSTVETSKWGAAVDFNLGAKISTGPEIWTGAFTAKNGDLDGGAYRREDMWPGERHKIEATRLRWTVGLWEQAQSMRGWYVKGGYSYTRITSRANRYLETSAAGDAVPTGVENVSPDDNTNIVTDTRHGIVASFGNRWLVWDQRLSIGVGASLTQNFKRSLTVDGRDPNAEADYNRMIDDLPDTRLSNRPIPEINMAAGYAF